jgi:hypothetical protein
MIHSHASCNDVSAQEVIVKLANNVVPRHALMRAIADPQYQYQ